MTEPFGGWDASARNVLVALKDLLSGLLGTYRLENGTTSVAAALVGSNNVNPNWKVSGAELTVMDVPDLQPVRGAGRGAVVATKQWTCRIVNYTPSTTLEAIQRRLVEAYPTGQFSYIPRTEDTIYEQLTFRLDELVILPLRRPA